MVTREDLDAFFAEGWNRHDADRLMTFMTDDCVFESAGGREVCGDRGLSEWVFAGTAADGRKVEVQGCDVFTFRGAKIAVKSSFLKNRTA